MIPTITPKQYRARKLRARTRFTAIVAALALFTGGAVFIPVYVAVHFVAKFW